MDIIVERFGADAAGKYDRGIRLAVPGYEALHGMTHALLRSHLGERARLLIGGAGTGAEVLNLGGKEPGWSLVGVDPSEAMISIARHRAQENGLQCRTELYTGYAQDLPDSPSFDAATAILVMHFLPDDGRKLDFLKAVFARLRPGAAFVLADLHGDPNSESFARFIAAWKIRQHAQGMEEKDVEEMFRDLHSVVRFVPEDRIVALMREAGLVAVERFYNALLFGAWTARKPDQAARTFTDG